MESASVEIEYGDDELRRAATDRSFRSEGWAPSLLLAYRETVQVLEAAMNARDLHALRCLRFEAPKESNGLFSIRVTGDHRLFVSIANANNIPLARVVAVAQTHQIEGAQR